MNLKVITGAGLLVLALAGCGKAQQHETTDSTDTGSDSSVFGRQGDTTNSSMSDAIQAPPDSGTRQQTVPREIKVTPRKQ